MLRAAAEDDDMPTQSVTAHLPVELVQKLDQYAERLERSRGWIVKQAIGDWIDREAERDRLTREALASADAGRLIDHDRVEEWLESLGSPNPTPLPQP
jgi:predicted transcriptional regulator